MGIDFRHSRTGSMRQNAFSLVELLVVMAISGILLALTVLGFNSLLTSSRMDQGGRLVVDEINLARQLAVTRNENVEIRFIRRNRAGETGASVYWQMQAGVVDKTNAAVFTPIKQAAQLPAGIVIETGTLLSPLLTQLPESNNIAPSYTYRSIVVRPTGEVEPAGTPPVNELSRWCFTLIPERQLGRPLGEIRDFVTVQIDPLTARPRPYRP